jgi:transposase InsO family protein
MDEYSRYVVHWELLPGMDGLQVSWAAQRAIDALPKAPDGKPLAPPEIRSDNGSGYISREFRLVLAENGLGHQQIKPHCPEENGLMERAIRTLREESEGEELTNLLEAEQFRLKPGLRSATSFVPYIGLHVGRAVAMIDSDPLWC